jgi:glucokinase
VSCFVPAAAGRPTALATEGGHSTLAAGNTREAAVIEALRTRFGHVSAERVLSGPGLSNLYTGLAQCDGETLVQRRKPGAIARAARAGKDHRAVETVKIFSALMGQFGGDVALKFGARGGVYIAGGVIGRLGPAFDTTLFRRRFEDKGRYRDWLAAVPTSIITHPRPAMVGLVRYLDDAAG